MTERSADPEIRLIPDYRDDEAPLPWYQALGVCKRMDEQEKPDDRELLHRMYDCLCVRGECCYRGSWWGRLLAGSEG